MGNLFLTTKNPQQMNIQLWNIQVITCASIAISFKTSTLEIDEEHIWMGAIDRVSSSTPPTLSTNNIPTLQPLSIEKRKYKKKDIRH